MKLIIAAIALVISTSAIAQTTTVKVPITCEAPEEIGKVLKEYRETVQIIGQSNQYGSGVSIWISPRGTYTILVREEKTGLYCVIDHGESLKLIYNGKAV